MLRWGIALAALLVAAGLCWWRTPRAFTWVGAYAAFTPPAISTAGFLLRSPHNTFTFYDWDGQKRWTVQGASASAIGYTDRVPAGLSPDGRTLVVGQFAGKTMRLTCWQDGRQSWTATVPVRERVYASTMTGATWAYLTVVSTTRVFFTVTSESRGGRYTTPEKGIYLVERGHPAASYGLPAGEKLQIAPDGRYLLRTRYLPATLNKRYTYCTWTAGNGRLVLVPRWSDDSLNYPRVYSDGLVVLGDTVYAGHGRLKFLRPQSGAEGTSEDFIMQVQGKQMSVISTATLDSWSLPCPRDVAAIGDLYTVANERYALLQYQPPLTPPAKLLARWVPGCRDMEDRGFFNNFKLYERPSHLRARMVAVGGVTHLHGQRMQLGLDDFTEMTLAPTPHRRVLLFNLDNSHGAPNTYLLGW